MFSIRVLLHVVPGALRADDILSILGRSDLTNKTLLRSEFYLDKSLPNHGNLALVTKEALIVPSQGLKSHKFCASKTSFAWKNMSILTLLYARL